MTEPYIELKNVSYRTGAGRLLFEGLNLRIAREHVGVVGRNGVGKSTLLSLISGEISASAGEVIQRTIVHTVPQLEHALDPCSRGERRRRALTAAQRSNAELLLLDEPTLHLDESAVSWLRGWLSQWRGGSIIVSHDRRLLADLRHFFVVSESGCHYFGGTLAELERHLAAEHESQEQRYLRSLQRLTEEYDHAAQDARRKARKRRRGRSAELDRCTPRIRLNEKRSQAQVSHGRLAKLREGRLGALHEWTQSTRRALRVELSLGLPIPSLPPSDGEPLIALHGVGCDVGGKRLFDEFDLRIVRERIAVVGPNGAGKTTLLEVMLGERRPDRGTRRVDANKIGYVAQGGRNWLRDESLLVHLLGMGLTVEQATAQLVAHKLPLALADRPLCSLSPGERARAALVALFSRAPTVELLVLDEPTFSLDLVGLGALQRALRAWPGGLIVASHDLDFLNAIGFERTIEL